VFGTALLHVFQLRSTFFSQTVLRTQFEKKKGGVVRAPKEVLHELQFFVELLHDEVYEAEFVEQSQTPSKLACRIGASDEIEV